jgi:hypothetical protein
MGVRTDKPAKDEKINHPRHYRGGSKWEVIKIIMIYGLSFNLGNVVKYVLRAGVKNQVTRIEDLKKARFYLEYEIMRLQGELDYLVSEE